MEAGFEIIGIRWSTNTTTGSKLYTLELAKPFSAYYADTAQGRGCLGKAVEEVYVGNADCANFAVGQHVEIYYDRMRYDKDGKPFQTIKHIALLD